MSKRGGNIATGVIGDIVNAITGFFGISDDRNSQMYQRVQEIVARAWSKKQSDISNLAQEISIRLQKDPYLPGETKKILGELEAKLNKTVARHASEMERLHNSSPHELNEKMGNKQNWFLTSKEFDASVKKDAMKKLKTKQEKEIGKVYTKEIQRAYADYRNNRAYNRVSNQIRKNNNSTGNRSASDHNIFSSPTISSVSRPMSSGPVQVENNIMKGTNKQ